MPEPVVKQCVNQIKMEELELDLDSTFASVCRRYKIYGKLNYTSVTCGQTVLIVCLCKRELTQMGIKALTESVEIPKGSQEEVKEGERRGEEHWRGEERWGCLTF